MLTSLVLVCFVGTFCAYSTYCTGVEYCLFVHRSFHNLLLDKRTSPHFLFYFNPSLEIRRQKIIINHEEVYIISCYVNVYWQPICTNQDSVL